MIYPRGPKRFDDLLAEITGISDDDQMQLEGRVERLERIVHTLLVAFVEEAQGEKTMSTIEQHAYSLLKSDPQWLADARERVALGNTIVGSVMAVTLGTPRWTTEAAVRAALDHIDEEE
jgi:hypothetical protein